MLRLASAFRKAIQDAIYNGDIQEINMKDFPTGCCTYASDLLQRFLADHGVFTWSMAGVYRNGQEFESHAWLETQDGTVIDITGDQYKHKALCFSVPVYVGTREDGFHNQFELYTPTPYRVDDDPFGRNREFNERYDAVMRHLRIHEVR
ncbi:MAG: lasso peptide biosynthesis protein [Clostridia bacterium]|nr:lasso peptide biosynthesis protein [Clostridia bacterium]